MNAVDFLVTWLVLAGVVGHVLVKGSAGVDVKNLDPTANTENRHIRFRCRLK